MPAPIIAFTDWLASWRQTGPEAHATLAASGHQLAVARRAALKELIAADPRLALEQAIPRSLRAELPADVVAELESPVDAFGRLEVVAMCFGSKDRTDRRVRLGGRAYQAYLYGQRLEALTKDHLAIHGIAIDDRLAVSELPYRRLEPAKLPGTGTGSGSLTVAVGDTTMAFPSAEALAAWSAKVATVEASAGPNIAAAASTPQAAPSNWVLGEKRVLWIRVDFSDAPGVPASDEEINTSMAKASEYFRDVSRDRCSLKTTIVPGVLRLVATKASLGTDSGAEDTLMADALARARAYDAAQGSTGLYNPDRYDRYIVIFNPSDSFLWAGLAYVGAEGLWLNGYTDSGVVAHELGHNQGLHHSHAWESSGTSALNSGTHSEYGDPFDIMGASSSMPAGHFNAKQKSLLQYLDSTETPTVTSSGVHRIYRHDARGASGVQAVSVAAGTAYDYWIEYRQQFPSSVSSEHEARRHNGVDLHWGKHPSFTTGAGTYLLDATPGSPGAMQDAPLALGETFTDPDYGINITPLTVGGTEPNQWIDVNVVLGATGNNHNPTVALPTTTGTLAARSDITFTATGSDPDGDTVYYRWDFGDGAFNSTASSITHRWIVGGTYDVSVTAIDAKGGLAKQTLTVTLPDPLLPWTRRAEGLTNSSFADIVYGGGQFVAVGSDGGAAFSPDGVTWAKAKAGVDSQFSYGVAYAAGRYVAVGYRLIGSGYEGSVAYSSDGITWQFGNLPSGARYLQKVAFGAGRFVAVSFGGKVYYSADGIDWVEVASGIAESLKGVRYSNGIFVAVGDNGRILTSTNGVAWDNRTPATCSADFLGVAWNNGTWCANSSYESWTSADAVVWTKASDFLGYSACGIGTGLGCFICPRSDGATYSENGRQWSSGTFMPSNSNYCRALAEGNGTVVVVGTYGFIYQVGTPTLVTPVLRDGATLTEVGAGQPVSLPVDASGYVKLELLVNGVSVAQLDSPTPTFTWTPPKFGPYSLGVRGTTAGGAAMTSPPVRVSATPRAWARVWHLEYDSYTSALFAGGRYVVTSSGSSFGAGWDGPLMTSPDGITWAQWALGASSNAQLKAVSYGQGTYIAVGYYGRIFTSADTATWIERTSGVTDDLNATASSSSLHVAAGWNGCITTSRDGLTWTPQVSGVQWVLRGACYGNNQFVVVGDGGTVLTSTDGITWTRRTIEASISLSAVTWADGIGFVAVGSSGAILTSPDGATWVSRASGVLDQLNSVVATPRGIVVLMNDCLRMLLSSDGIDWSSGSLPGVGYFHMTGCAYGPAGLLAVGEYGTMYQSSPFIRNPADFDGDGHNDLLWENTGTGQRYAWLMNNTSFASGADLGTLSIQWHIAGTGDFNGDGKSDLVWENTTTGDRYVWLMNGTSWSSSVYLGNLPTAWRIAGTGDFNADGKADLVWENTVTGDRYLWLMDGTTWLSSVYLGNLSTQWRITGTGDFNADGQTDLVWENTATGDRYVWMMSGSTYANSAYIGNAPVAWHIAGAGDFNGDGQPDILWENTTTGERGLWLMSGTSFSSWVSLGIVPTAWRIRN